MNRIIVISAGDAIIDLDFLISKSWDIVTREAGVIVDKEFVDEYIYNKNIINSYPELLELENDYKAVLSSMIDYLISVEADPIRDWSRDLIKNKGDSKVVVLSSDDNLSLTQYTNLLHPVNKYIDFAGESTDVNEELGKISNYYDTDKLIYITANPYEYEKVKSLEVDAFLVKSGRNPLMN